MTSLTDIDLAADRSRAPDALGRSPLAEAGTRDASLDCLRAFTVLLVLLHHAMIAYASLGQRQPRIFEITNAPIVDPQRSAGLDLLLAFNDTFFMALMFLLSGLFVWPSLRRKGGAKFLRDRVLRLGVPFVIAAGLLMPLAYYPAYVVTGADPGFLAYARAWLSLGFWPAGPAWFIWLLLVFDAVAAVLYGLWHRSRLDIEASDLRAPNLQPLDIGVSWGVSWLPGAFGRTPALVALLLVLSALAYIPMELAFGAERWPVFAAFSLQVSRLFLYALFFLAGTLWGAAGSSSGTLARGAGLARRWPAWVAAGLAAYALRLLVLVGVALPAYLAHRPLSLGSRLLSDITLVLCCVLISVAFIAIFRRFAGTRRPWLDSLSASSYGIYLVHYPIVIWLQFALLTVALGPIAKAGIAFVGAVAVSWGLVVTLRGVPEIARVI